MQGNPFTLNIIAGSFSIINVNQPYQSLLDLYMRLF